MKYKGNPRVGQVWHLKGGSKFTITKIASDGVWVDWHPHMLARIFSANLWGIANAKPVRDWGGFYKRYGKVRKLS